MQTEKTRKVRNIESKIIKGIMLKGACHVAGIVGVHESQVSRWQRPQTRGDMSFIEKCARLLDAIGYEEPTTDTVMLQGDEARALIQMLGHIRTPKRKAPAVTEAKSQINLVLYED